MLYCMWTKICWAVIHGGRIHLFLLYILSSFCRRETQIYVFIFDVVPIPETGNQQPLTTHGLHIWPFLLRYSRTGPVNKLQSRLLDYYCFDNDQNTTEFVHGLSAAVARSWSGSYYPLWCGCSAVDPDPQGAICLTGPGCVLRSTRLCLASWARNLRS